MRMLNLALKDIRQVMRDKRTFLFMLLMPIVFTFVMGLAFSSSNTGDQRPVVGLLDRDGSAASQELKNMLNNDANLKVVELSEAQAIDAENSVQKGTYAAFISVPVGFEQALLDQKALSLNVIADAANSSGNAAIQTITLDVEHLTGSAETTNLVKDQLLATKKIDAAGAAAFSEQVLQKALQSWKNTTLSVEVQTIAAEPARQTTNPYSQTSPGMLVQFVVFGLMSSANIIVFERKSRTLQRLLTTSMKRIEVVAGHFLAMSALVLLQESLLILFGALVLKVGYFNHPLATLSIAVYFALWSASLGLLIGMFARSEEQTILFSLLAMFLFTSMGGAWFPLEDTGKAFSTIAHFFPTAWAMDAFQYIVQRGLGVSSIVLPSLVLLGYTLLFFGLAVWHLRREV